MFLSALTEMNEEAAFIVSDLLFNIKGYVFWFKTTYVVGMVKCYLFISYRRIVRVKDINSGKFTDIYNAKEVISRLNAPIVKDPTVIHL